MNNKPQINNIKVISAYAVFLIHYISIYMTVFGINDILLTNIKLSCNFAVPVFFMASGYLHDGKKYSYKKIILRTIYFYIVTIFFNSLFQIFNILLRNREPISFMDIVLNSSRLKLVTHLWFMPCIICIYLFIPVFSLIDNECLMVFTIINVILGFIRPIYFSFFYIPFPLQYFFTYFLIGQMYNRLNKKRTDYILFFCIFGLTVLCLMNIKDIFNYYDNIGTLLYSQIVFLLILNHTNSIKLIENIANTTFLVYITHPILIHLLFTILKYRVRNYFEFFMLSILMFCINVFLIKSYFYCKYHILKISQKR